MTALTKAPPAPWSDVRLAEVTAKAATAPNAFGTQANAWRCASLTFMEAHRATQAGKTERATELRRSAFATLHGAGLRVEQAITAQHLDAATGADSAAPTSVPLRLRMVTECTARMVWLRDQADGATHHYAERAAVQYAASACYERAVREWNRQQTESAGGWMQAAEQELANHLVPAPWHPQPESSGPTD